MKTNEIYCFISPASNPILKNWGQTNTKHKSDVRLILFRERTYKNAGRLDEEKHARYIATIVVHQGALGKYSQISFGFVVKCPCKNSLYPYTHLSATV